MYFIILGGKPLNEKIISYICCPKHNGCVAQLNRASDYGSEGFRFESWRGHLITITYKGRYCGLLFFANHLSIKILDMDG